MIKNLVFISFLARELHYVWYKAKKAKQFYITIAMKRTLNSQKMTQEQIKSELTPLELSMLETIVSCYDIDDNICYSGKLSSTEKGVIGSLVKKKLVYDSFEDMHNEIGYGDSNFFPSYAVLDAYNKPHY
jgi:hypothetical protein